MHTGQARRRHAMALALAAAVAAGGMIWAQAQPAPLDAVFEKIMSDFKARLAELDARYDKQLQPIQRQRALAIDTAGDEAMRRLGKAGRDLKAAGSEVGEAMAKAQIEELKKQISQAKAPKAGGLWRLEFGGHGYLPVLAAVTWHEAKKACEEMGGHLAIIETLAERDFLIAKTGGVGLWIGCTDEHREGDWRWLDGRAVDPKAVGGFKPDNAWGGQHYGIVSKLGLDDDGKKGDKGAGFICEWE